MKIQERSKQIFLLFLTKFLSLFAKCKKLSKFIISTKIICIFSHSKVQERVGVNFIFRKTVINRVSSLLHTCVIVLLYSFIFLTKYIYIYMFEKKTTYVLVLI